MHSLENHDIAHISVDAKMAEALRLLPTTQLSIDPALTNLVDYLQVYISFFNMFLIFGA